MKCRFPDFVLLGPSKYGFDLKNGPFFEIRNLGSFDCYSIDSTALKSMCKLYSNSIS